MTTEKSSGEAAKTVNDSKSSPPNGTKPIVVKSNQSKPGVDEIRRRAFEIFQARHGGPGSAIGDWQKAEASVSAETAKAEASKSDVPKANEAKPEAVKVDDGKADASEIDAPTTDGAKADTSKSVKVPTDTGTIEEAVTKFKSSIKDGLTQEEAAARLKKDGPNAIKEVHINPIMRFLKFLWGPIAWMIEIAGDTLRGGSALGRLYHDLFHAGAECGGRLLGGIQGRQRDRSAEKASGTCIPMSCATASGATFRPRPW